MEKREREEKRGKMSDGRRRRKNRQTAALACFDRKNKKRRAPDSLEPAQTAPIDRCLGFSAHTTNSPCVGRDTRKPPLFPALPLSPLPVAVDVVVVVEDASSTTAPLSPLGTGTGGGDEGSADLRAGPERPRYDHIDVEEREEKETKRENGEALFFFEPGKKNRSDRAEPTNGLSTFFRPSSLLFSLPSTISSLLLFCWYKMENREREKKASRRSANERESSSRPLSAASSPLFVVVFQLQRFFL